MSHERPADQRPRPGRRRPRPRARWPSLADAPRRRAATRSRRVPRRPRVGALVGAAIAGAARGSRRTKRREAAPTPSSPRHHGRARSPLGYHCRRCRRPASSAIRGSRRVRARSGRASWSSSPSAATRRPQREPRAGGRPDAAVHELGDGPVQGRADRRREARLRPRRRLPALPPRRRQAQRLRGGRPDAAPPHAVRDARQLELRRLLQARGDPLGLGLPDPRPRDPRRPAGRDGLHDRRPRPRGLEGRDRPAAGAPRALGRLPGRRREELVADGRRRAVRPVLGAPLRPRRRTSRRAPSASPTTASTARAGSRSGTSCSWSSSSTRIAP